MPVALIRFSADSATPLYLKFTASIRFTPLKIVPVALLAVTNPGTKLLGIGFGVNVSPAITACNISLTKTFKTVF